MIGKDGKLRLLFTLMAAVVMLLALGGVAFAGGDDSDIDIKDDSDGLVCVEGYVINHREQPVDGTKTDPTLVVMANKVDETTASAAIAPTVAMTDTTAITETVPLTATEELTPTVAVAPVGQFSADVDSKGYFLLEGLPAGDLNFWLQLPDGWEGIVPVADRGGIAQTGVTKLDDKSGCYRIVFKVRRVFDVIVIKWEEAQDGTVTPGEDWEITATPVADPFVKPQTEWTDANGQAGFTLTPGKWVISEKVKSGWTPVTPIKVTLVLDQYAKPGAMDPVVFKNREPACYSKIVVHKIGFGVDPSGNEVQLGPLAGWKVTLKRADNASPPITKHTDAAGQATFANLPPGVYTVTEVVQGGWEAMSDNPQTIIHRDCETTDVTFNNREIIGKLTIFGTKWFKAWVPPYKGKMVGLAGWEITATLVGTSTSISTVTDALGHYRFTEADLKAAGIGFPGATVKVCEEDRDNWIHVTPKCVNVTFPYPVPVTYTGAKVDFTNIQDPPAGATVDTTVSAPSAGCLASHVVASGETLAKIATRYGTSLRAIARQNGIKNIDVIYVGQKLCIN